MKDWLGEPANWLEVAQRANYRAANLARLLDVSLRQLERGFKDCNRAPQDWLDEVRIWKAIDLLAQGVMAKNLPAELGFESESNFYHKFKACHGCTPAECVEIQLRLEAQRQTWLKEHACEGERSPQLCFLLPHERALATLARIPARSRRLQLYLFQYKRRL